MNTTIERGEKDIQVRAKRGAMFSFLALVKVVVMVVEVEVS